MNNEFIEKLKDHEKAVYEKGIEKRDRSKNTVRAKVLLSPLNDLIRFNPFQYEPYYKLTQQEKDPIKAIYIADEVGAGKTIETGIIMTELIFRGEFNLFSDTCMIICPNMLCVKWRYTLKSLFGLNASIVYSYKDIKRGINILSYNTVSNDKTNKISDLGYNPKILIMDEAHNASGKRYEKLMDLRNRIREGYILLLSATPLSGGEKDEDRQVSLLKEGLEAGAFFDRESIYLCKNKKLNMRYVSNPARYIVNCSIDNHFISDKLFNRFFDLGHGRVGIRGMNMFISSPVAGEKFIDNCLRKTDQELCDYLNFNYIGESEDEIEDESDDESEDVDDDISDDEVRCTLAEIPGIKSELSEIKNNLRKIINEEKTDTKLMELIRIVEDNQEKSLEEWYMEHDFYKHIIVFTNRVSTAKYLENKLPKELSVRGIENSVFCVTGELFESEKRERIQRYENVKDEMSILIITNVACEGQDMDYGNTLVNYDLDYNPVRLEQRRGRIDRFEVKKDNIFIHNFMVEGFDYDPKDKLKSFNYKYSKVKKIWDKIEFIKEHTGTYYEILKEREYNDQSYGSKVELDIIKQNVFGNVFSLVQGDASDVDFDKLKLKELYDLIYDKSVKQFGNFDSAYDLISNKLKKLSVEVKAEDEKNIIIKSRNNNLEFLQYIYAGGTMVSHILFDER